MAHLKLNALQRQWLQVGFLLAHALGRTLVLPPLWCVVDRFWTILDHCLIGSKVGWGVLCSVRLSFRLKEPSATTALPMR